MGNVGELKDAATRCAFRPVDASKCVCGRGSAGGAYSTPPDHLAGFRGGELGRGSGKG